MISNLSQKIKNNYYLFLPFLLILIASTFYYVVGYNIFGDNFSQYFFPRYHINDETSYYFSQVIYLYSNFSFDMFISELVTNMNAKMWNLFIFALVPMDYFPMVINFINTSLIFTILYFIGRDIFKFTFNYNIFFVFLFTMTSGWGITTYNEWIELFTITPNGFSTLFRQEPPSTTLLLISTGIYLIHRFFIQKAGLLSLALGTLLVTLTYVYYTTFFIVFLGLLGIYVIYNWKLIEKKQYILFYTFSFFALLIWTSIYLNHINPDFNWLVGKTISRDINLKILIINLFFTLLAYFSYKKTKILKQKKIILIVTLGIISGVIANHSNLILGYTLQNHHWDVYVIKPLQWILVFYIVYIFKLYTNKAVAIIPIVLSILFTINAYKAPTDLYLKHHKVLSTQLDVIKSYKKLNKYIKKGDHYITLDPLLIYMSKIVLPTSIIDIYFNGHHTEKTAEKLVESYIKSSQIHKLTPSATIDLFNTSKSDKYLQYFGMFKMLLLSWDSKDNIYQSLSTEYKIITSDNISEYLINEYNDYTQEAYDGVIVINKLQFSQKIIDKISLNKSIIFKDKNLILLKCNPPKN